MVTFLIELYVVEKDIYKYANFMFSWKSQLRKVQTFYNQN